MLTIEQRVVELERLLRRERLTRGELGEVLRARVANIAEVLDGLLGLVGTQAATIEILTKAAVETKAVLEAQSRLIDTLRAASAPLGGGRRYDTTLLEGESTNHTIPDNI